MHYYQFNIGDYMRDTAHLDEMEDLAYRRMLDLYYLRESPLPDDVKEIAKLIRMRSHCDCIANVLREFFTLSSKGWVNTKADTVLTKIYSKSAKAKSAANKRWENQSVKNADALQTHCQNYADAMLPNTQYPIPNTDIKDIDDSKESPSIKNDFVKDLFDKFWKHYKYKQGKQKALVKFTAFMKGKPEAKARFWMNLMLAYYMDCMDRQVLGYENLHAATYIHNKRWEDSPEFMEDFKREWIKEIDNG